MAITWQHLSKKHFCCRMCSVLSGDPGFMKQSDLLILTPVTMRTNRDRHSHSHFFPSVALFVKHSTTKQFTHTLELAPSPSWVFTALDQSCCLGSSKPSPCVQCPDLAAVPSGRDTDLDAKNRPDTTT